MLSKPAVGEVLLQTVMVKVRGPGGEKMVRLLLDSGSQRSYIRSSVAEALSLVPIGVEWLSQTVFGGSTSAAIKHSRFRFPVSSIKGKFSRELEALDQPMICGRLPRLRKGPWIKQLKDQNIWISDLGEEVPEIDILIGSDLYGELLTGRKITLECGLIAMETVFGWTVLGRIESDKCSSLVSHVISMTTMEGSVPDLWSLETLGIRDPAENLSKTEREAAAHAHFKRTVRRDDDGRYEVSLPWVADRTEIPSNEEVAKKRLQGCTKKLQMTGYVREYCQVFQDWLSDGIIEEVPAAELGGRCHYLPHRPVIKDSKTTPVRPVFDASCKVGRSPSLNDCLEKGPSMLELIPAILTRFREKKYGLIADIKKAFLTIGIDKADRDYLRFLWWESEDAKALKVYRHKRVVFGVNCSPFLLAAVIEHHLSAVSDDKKELSTKLARSLYVDNCVTSVDSVEEMLNFKEESTALLATAKMDLRLWEHTSTGDVSGIDSLISRECGLDTGSTDQDDFITMVLGLKWNKKSDSLACEVKDHQVPEVVSKRKILSITHGIFDPLGFLAPVLLRAKLLLKEAWASDCGWDDKLPESIRKSFVEWASEVSMLREIQVPRWAASADRSGWSLHIFCDASKSAYAAVVFLRCDGDQGVTVQMLQANTRVSPPKTVSICRLELLACTIGSRLADSVKNALFYPDVPCTYWSDSTTAIAWIKRNDDWGTFVGNRVREILKLSSSSDWNHVPGIHNPADLPSRGCSAKFLCESRWWEGPGWLKLKPSDWPVGDEEIDEDSVAAERKKSAVVLVAVETERPWYAGKFSSYTRIVRFVAWMKRYIQYIKLKAEVRKGPLNAEEIITAETTLLLLVQKDSFTDAKVLGDLHVKKDEGGLIRVETKITRRDDDHNFRFPIVLPSNHIVVETLVRELHLRNCHAGVQVLMVMLRENYWILKSRQVIRRVVRGCVRCKRFEGKSMQVEPCALPLDRVKTVATFQVTGVDLAGPLYLKDGRKTWIVLYTCGVYRAVHLELVLTLSTEGFLQSFRRFVARRGRPSVVYSDNGTNFQGAENLFRALDWTMIEETFGIQKIKWRFNPPGGPWWGGWWERLVQMVKKLLLRTLGKSSLLYEELETILCDVEALINSRPLTYVSEDSHDLAPLTPAMFLRDLDSSAVPEVDILEQSGFQKRFRYRQKLRQDLRSRFRKEYLSQLVQRKNEKTRYDVQVGDVVIIGSENRKRLDWPLARVIELIPGRDGKVRIAKLKTATGELIRPLQRIHPLEVDVKAREKILEKPQEIEVTLEKKAEEDGKSAKDPECVFTRSGRKVVKPARLNQ